MNPADTVTAPIDGTASVRLAAPRSGTRQFFQRLRRSPKGLTGAMLVSFAILAALSAPVIAPYSPTKQTVRAKFAKPTMIDRNSDYILGGDNFGRDILSRILYGSRASLAIGFLVTLPPQYSARSPGQLPDIAADIFDTVIMRLVDLQASIPFILLAMIVLAIMGPGFWSVFVALCRGALSW